MVDIIINPVKNVAFENDTMQIEKLLISSGGDSNNNAVDLAKLGHQVTYMGRVGCDSMGSFVIAEAEKFGIDMSHSPRSNTAGQAMSVVLVNPEGDRTFLQSSGTSGEFCFEDCDLSVLDWADVLQISAVYHLPRFDGKGARKLLEAAKARGVITSMDISTDRSGRWEDVVSICCPYLDYFLPSIEQASMIAKTEDPREIAAFFLSRGAKNVVVKLGKRGSYFRNAESAFWAGTYSELEVVETTGAGDAFCAGFLTGVGEGLSPEECVAMGTAASSMVIQAMGATAGMGDRAALRAFMEARPPLKITQDKVALT